MKRAAAFVVTTDHRPAASAMRVALGRARKPPRQGTLW